MRWLLWKDFRHNGPIVTAGLLLLLAPYLVVLGLLFWPGIASRPDWREGMFGASMYSLVLSQLTVALIGGNAMAGERVDRSAEFQAALPITRKKILASKLLLALIVVAVVWLFNGPVMYFCLREKLPIDFRRPEELVEFVTNLALTGLLFFGVAWFLSSFLTSPTLAVAGGLVTPLLFLLTLYFVSELLRIVPPVHDVELPYRIFCLSLAPLGFAFGTYYYLRRVEP